MYHSDLSYPVPYVDTYLYHLRFVPHPTFSFKLDYFLYEASCEKKGVSLNFEAPHVTYGLNEKHFVVLIQSNRYQKVTDLVWHTEHTRRLNNFIIHDQRHTYPSRGSMTRALENAIAEGQMESPPLRQLYEEEYINDYLNHTLPHQQLQSQQLQDYQVREATLRRDLHRRRFLRSPTPDSDQENTYPDPFFS
jgi:hypothetical protein